jgi:hypothetical protein
MNKFVEPFRDEASSILGWLFDPTTLGFGSEAPARAVD